MRALSAFATHSRKKVLSQGFRYGVGACPHAKLRLRLFQMTTNCLFAETECLGHGVTLRPC